MKLREEISIDNQFFEQLDIADLNSIGFVKHKHQLSKDNTQMDGSIERESKGEAKIIFIDNTEEKHSCAGWQDDRKLHNQLPIECDYLQSTRVYGDYQLIIAINSSTL